MGAKRTWTNLLFLILRQITRMGTDKTDSLKQETQVSFLSVLVVKFVVKILFPPAEEEIEPRITRTDAKVR